MNLRQFQRQFAERVRTLRAERGLRQEDLEDFGLSWKSVQKLEYGITDPKVSTLLKLCRAFAVPLPQLLEFDQPPSESSQAATQSPTRRRRRPVVE